MFNIYILHEQDLALNSLPWFICHKKKKKQKQKTTNRPNQTELALLTVPVVPK